MTTDRTCRRCGRTLTPREITHAGLPGYCWRCDAQLMEEKIESFFRSWSQTRKTGKSERTGPVLPRGKPAQIDPTGHAIPQSPSPEPPWGSEILEWDTYAWPKRGDVTDIFTADDIYRWLGPPEGRVGVNISGAAGSNSGSCPGCGSWIHSNRKNIFCPVCGCQNTLG